MSYPESHYLSPVWRDGIFNGKVAFITGGNGTICSMQARALVRLGANACIVGRNVDKTEQAARDIAAVRSGAKVIGIGACDVRNAENVKAAADRCAKELGGIDYVVAGAAGNFVAPMEGLSSNAFKSVMDIDVLGTFHTIKATMPYLLASATPRILFVSATFHYTGMVMQSHVSAAKAAVDALMASVALEYGPRGLTSNVIAPGAIEGTEGMQRLGGDSTATDSSSVNPLVREIPSGCLGTVRDIADATVYLFSDTGRYVNGHALVVDGGGWRRQSSYTLGTTGYRYPDIFLGDDKSKL